VLHSIDTGLLEDLASVGAGVMAIVIVMVWRRSMELTRSDAVVIGFTWTVVWSAEYWIFGPSSFVSYYDEANYYLPQILNRVRWFDGGTFFHAIAGGTDAWTSSQSGEEYFSLEIFLFKTFPLWIALLVNKVLVCSTSYIGAYLLCRRGTGCSRFVASALAAIYSVSHPYVSNTTVLHGIGFAILPLAIYLIVIRVEKDNYFKGVIVLAAVHAISSSFVAHSTLALFPAIILGAFMFDTKRWDRVVGSCVLLLVALLANWHEVIYAQHLASGDTARVAFGQADVSSVYGVVEFGVRYINGKVPVSLLTAGMVGIAGLWLLRHPLAWRATVTVCLSLFAGAAMHSIPWPEIGLSSVGAVELNRIGYSYSALVLPILGLVSAAPGNIRFGLPKRRLLSAALCGLAIAMLVGLKTSNLVNWLGWGGQSSLAAIPNLVSRDWQPNEPFRVVTVPYRIYPNFMLAYGLELFDGHITLSPLDWMLTWHRQILRPQYKNLDRSPNSSDRLNRSQFTGGDMYIAYNRTSNFRGATRFDVTKWVDVNLLRVGNVSHIISYVPLIGGGIRQVSGPPPSEVSRRSKPFKKKIANDFRRIFDPDPVYIYAIPNPLPRVFFAKRAVIVDEAVGSDAFFQKVSAFAPDGVAVMPAVSADQIGSMESSGEVIKFDQVPDGFDLEVRTEQGGLAVINTKKRPFWNATVDGREARIFAVNGFHMAVYVPSGGRSVKLRYVRPTLRGVALDHFK